MDEIKKNSAPPSIDFGDNNIKFDDKTGLLIINNESYTVDYIPAGSTKVAALDKAGRNKIALLAMNILKEQKLQLKPNEFEGLTINQQGIKILGRKDVVKFNEETEIKFSEITQFASHILDTQKKDGYPPLKKDKTISLKKNVRQENEIQFNKGSTSPNLQHLHHEDDRELQKVLKLSEQMLVDKREAVKFKDSELNKQGWFRCKEVKPDGNCLFSALGEHLGLGNDENKQQVVRQHLASHLYNYQEYYQNAIAYARPHEYAKALLEGPKNELWDRNDINSKKGWGGDIEILLAADIYKRPIVFITDKCTNIQFNRNGLPQYNEKEYPQDKLCVFGKEYEGAYPIYLYYNGRDHYDALFL